MWQNEIKKWKVVVSDNFNPLDYYSIYLPTHSLSRIWGGDKEAENKVELD